MIFSSVCFVFFILKSSSSSGTFQIMNGGDFRDQVRRYSAAGKAFIFLSGIGSWRNRPAILACDGFSDSERPSEVRIDNSAGL
jgi:hypothetical protein